MKLWGNATSKRDCRQPADNRPPLHTEFGRQGTRLVLRVVLWQAGCAASAALLFWVLQGATAGAAAGGGGLIVATGSALFGWRLFAPGIAPALVLRRALFAAESLKWFWYVLAVWAALTRFKAEPLPLLAGLVLAQFGYWAGLKGKRG